jgi:hypothetical protein
VPLVAETWTEEMPAPFGSSIDSVSLISMVQHSFEEELMTDCNPKYHP